MTNYTVTVQPIKILDGYQGNGVTLTNVGATQIYIANDSAVTTINQVIDIGGSMYFEPYTEVWAGVTSANFNGLLTAVFDASDRFSNPTPGITFIGSFPTTGAGLGTSWDFDLGASVGSQFKAFKVVVRFPNSGITPTTAGDYEYTVGAKLNFIGAEQQFLASSILVDNSVFPVTTLAPAYVIIPLTTATSGTLFISPPVNTAAAGELVMDVYGLSNAPAQVIAWQDPSVTLSTNWKRKGNLWYFEIASLVTTPTAYFLPAMGANFTVGCSFTLASAVSQTVQLRTFTATPATTATQYVWDTNLFTSTGLAGSFGAQRTYTTTPGIPLTMLFTPGNAPGMTNIRIWVQNNAQIGA